MERRRFVTALVALPALGLLAACGSDTPDDSLQTSDTTAGTTADPSPETTAAPTTEPQADVVSSEPILSYTLPGGFTSSQFAFQDPPLALLTADGTLIGSAPTPEIFPGPLLPGHLVRTVSPAGIDALIAAADAAGLLADVDYSTDGGLVIADAPTTLLTITTGGTTYTHEAEALGIAGGLGDGDTESTPEREALLAFLTALKDDPASILGAENLGEPTAYEPTAYQLIAMQVDDLSGFEPMPTIQAWPVETGIDLATTTGCVEVERAVVGDLFDQATQLTFFEQNGVNYQVTPRAAYPGRSC